MKQLDGYLFGSVAAVRPYLMIKAVLLLLALDAWVVMSGHGGRYGVGGFNVSHFGWLDALQPVPSSALYVGLVLFVGLLAFAIATAGTQHIALGALAVIYSYGWMMSMLDSYQHHYLLSILLVAFVGWPQHSARQLFVDPPLLKGKRKKAPLYVAGPTASAWAYVLACCSIAIVYGYTAIAKTEEAWRTGDALRRIAPDAMRPFEDYFVVAWGMPSETFWSMVGHSVIMVQVVIAAAYVAAPLRDHGDRGMRVICWLGFLAAASFHLGAEYLELRIGWFSWYMLAIAAICFLPAEMVHAAGWALSWPARRAGNLWDALVAREGFGAAGPAAAGAAGIAVVAGFLVDLPGARAAGILAGVLLIAVVAWLVRERRVAETLRYILAGAGGAVLMWIAIASSDVRFDYYRKVGGVMRRHGEYAEAYEAYRKANLYAPPGEDRRDREEEMRTLMEAEQAAPQGRPVPPGGVRGEAAGGPRSRGTEAER